MTVAFQNDRLRSRAYFLQADRICLIRPQRLECAAFQTGWQSVYVPRQDSHPHPLQKIYRTKLFCIHYTEDEGLLHCLKAKYLDHLQKDMDAIDYNIHVV